MANRSTILSEIHSAQNASELASLENELVNLNFDTGNLQELSYLQNHIGREFYRKLDSFDSFIEYPDPLDAGFRPLTVTGLLQIT